MSDDPFAKVASSFVRGLEVKPAVSDAGYRGSAESPLEGEWLGGYSDARMLEPYSPMRVEFTGDRATGEDDAGVSTWTLVSRKGRDHEWLKAYGLGEWQYRGRKQPHAFIGAWTSPGQGRRAGCFWLVPAHRFSDKHAAKLRRGAKRRFWPATGAQAVSLAVIAGSIYSISLLPWWLCPLPFVLVWFALKDSLPISGAAQEIFRVFDEPIRARFAESLEESEEHEEDELTRESEEAITELGS